MNYSGIGIIIENQNGKFLLHLRDGNTSRMKNQWYLVGGSIDEGETILEASIREVKEETALTLKDPLYLKDFIYDGRTIALVKGSVNTEQENLTLGEGADLKLFSKDEAMSLINSLNYSNPYLREFSNYLLAIKE